MNELTDARTWLHRSFLLSCIIALPFAGFLLSNHYPFLRVESLAALLCLMLVSAALAAASRNYGFRALALGCASAVSAAPIQRTLSPIHIFSLPMVTVGTLALLGALMLLLRRDFFRILLVFAAGALLAHIYQSGRPGPAAAAAVDPPSGRPAHFLYLVLDEHMGPAGLPETIAACRTAARSINRTFDRYGFSLFPFAYSNFAMTLDSLPSVMNRQIPERRRMLLHPGSPDPHGIHSIDARRFFAEFRSRGYAISMFQYHTINFARGEAARVVEYPPLIGALADVEGAWSTKFRLLVGAYQNSDVVLSRVKGFFPFRFGPRQLGPLYLTTLWPKVLVQEIFAARQPTFFFVHLLTPHGPYVFRKDGSERRLEEWVGDADYQRLDAADYMARYERYAGQIEYVQSQLRDVLAALDQHNLLDQMTVVVHGDHGSRIRRRDAQNIDLSQQLHLDRYDYTGAPGQRDLRDRFSALLAVKLPHEHHSSTVERKESVLRLLSEVLYREGPTRLGPAVDNMFLFDEWGNAKQIRSDHLWNQ